MLQGTDTIRPHQPPLKRHLAATRPAFLLLALVAVGIGLATSHTTGLALDPVWAALTLLGAVALHAAANVHNDYADDVNGSDAANHDRQSPFTGGSRMIQAGAMTRRETRQFARWLYAMTIAIGTILLIPGGWPLLILGLGGLLIAWAYSGPPLSLNAKGGGEIAVGIGFGILIPLGADIVQRGAFHAMPLAAGTGFALITASLLLINQFPDVRADRLAGKHHWVVRLGPRRARHVFLITTTAAYLTPIILVAAGLLPVTALAVFAALPLSAIAAHDLWRHYATPGRLRRALASTVAATLLHGSLLIAGLVFAA
ncbi:MAG: prenyltransferase [Guyparkeria sp.]